jgi:glycosyltransferase involved in cell wall biosynthesis
MKVLVLSNVAPRVLGVHKSGAEVVTYETLRLLAANPEFQLAYAQTTLQNSKNKEVVTDDLLSSVTVLPQVILNPPVRCNSFWTRNARRILGADMIAGLGQQDKISRAFGSWKPDVILTVWSDVATAAASALDIPIVAYCGNPGHKSFQAHIAIEARWEPRRSLFWFTRQLADRIFCRRFEAAHLEMMRRISCVADVHANDTAYYRSRGVYAHYIRSMWPAPATDQWRNRRDQSEQVSPIKIAANVGSLAGTANTFGLWTIGEELLPAFRKEIGDGNFELHIYGPKSPQPFLLSSLSDHAIRVRGFVEDLDAELYSCPVYIVANNRHAYKAGHNRFLHAWALGACVVTWRDSAQAMPELVHGENALLAEDAISFAHLTLRAASDRDLRRRIGEGGRRTLLKNYDPPVVVAQISALLRHAAGHSRQTLT